MFDTLVHKWLRVPYTLNVREQHLTKHAHETYVFIHGIGDTGAMWRQVIDKLPTNVDYVTVDLLGFGDSPSPRWSKYNAKVHARSVLATVLRLRITSPVTVVGHSLGGLIAVEFAKHYPLLIRRLILCSPPIYELPKTTPRTKIASQQEVLRRFYAQVAKDPTVIVNGYALGQKLGIINKSLNVQNENVDLFISTLEQSIINQDTIHDIATIRQPVTVISGAFDPLVVLPTLVRLSRRLRNVRLLTVPAGHIISSTYVKVLLKVLDEDTKDAT